MTSTSAITVERTTGETSIRITASLGRGESSIETGVPFLDHMLVVLSRYAGLDLVVRARGDLRHHVIEDTALALGAAIARAIPATAARYGERTVPMDDALVQAVLDVGGRPFYQGPLPSSLYDHFMRSLCDAGRFTLHLRVLRGEDRHAAVSTMPAHSRFIEA